MSDTSLNAKFMSINEVLDQLSSLKDNSMDMAKADDAESIWQRDVDALESAIAIISALQDEGISDAEGVRDLIFDYDGLGKQCKELTRKFCTASAPTHKDGVWHCPECNARTSFNHTHCHRCGKKLGGWHR